jgi:hypothetical protein
MKKICFSMFLVFLVIFLGSNRAFAADYTESFDGWGFVDATPALSEGVYEHGTWRFVAKQHNIQRQYHGHLQMHRLKAAQCIQLPLQLHQKQAIH